VIQIFSLAIASPSRLPAWIAGRRDSNRKGQRHIHEDQRSCWLAADGAD